MLLGVIKYEEQNEDFTESGLAERLATAKPCRFGCGLCLARDVSWLGERPVPADRAMRSAFGR